ncbi:hypothetical protein C8P68_103133 [Mucilaginibacter yixingensis]|uniref:Acyl-CoA reductase LuxC n=2 Tax=Mucilaginibacter yixingensis TaxID=1295612 RepID=A0A2T5JAT7_9SPHI|nr:hypothetical protein C8P68_103133 [Mucilaginibacter yixingensis]
MLLWGYKPTINMSKFIPQQYINAFSALGQQLNHPEGELRSLIQSEHLYNPWFTQQSVLDAVMAIGAMLSEENLAQWLSRYPEAGANPSKKVGLILAGNIPLVGFHDVLCVLISGHEALIKTSAQDTRLIKYVLQLLTEIEPDFAGKYQFVERLAGFEAVIATGSNNTSRYFEFYFGKVPHIIRKNRNSVALLTGNETTAQLHQLGNDIFEYFGLGCRNVSKMMVPEGYDFVPFFESIESYNEISNHHKYHNNYDYNKSIYLVNKDKHLDNGFLLVKEDTGLTSPLAVLHYETYTDLADAEQKLQAQTDNIQCVVTIANVNLNNQVVGFGQSQHPAVWDYADGVDTMRFLAAL